jgi:hypothetical protein
MRFIYIFFRYFSVFYTIFSNLITKLINRLGGYFYLSSLNYTFMTVFFINPENTSILILIFGACFCILVIFMLRNLTFNYSDGKITNWFYTYFISILYTFVFLGVFFFLRILLIKNPINLKKVIYFVNNCISEVFLINNTYQNIFIFLAFTNLMLLFYIFLLILKHFHNFYRHELIKLHIYYQGSHKYTREKPYFYRKFLEIYNRHLCFYEFKSDLQIHLLNLSGFTLIDKLFPKLRLGTYRPYPVLKYFTDLLPFTLGISFFVYDIFMHDCILIYTTNYLPIFFMFILWKNYSDFLMYQDTQILHMLFEMYYCYPSVVYINVSKNHQEELKMCLKNSLKQQKSLYINVYENGCDAHYLQIWHRFEKVKNSYFYNSPCTTLTFHWSELKIRKNSYSLRNFHKFMKKSSLKDFYIFENDFN